MPEYISLQQASKYIGYSHDYLRLRARQGKLEAKKIGRNWVTTKEWLDEYVSKVNEYNTVKQKKEESSPPTITLPIQPRPRSRAIAVWVLAVFLLTAGTVFGYPYIGRITKSLTNTVNNLAVNTNEHVSKFIVSLDIDTEFLSEVKQTSQEVISNIPSFLKNVTSFPKDKVEQLSETNVDLYTKILKTRNFIINTSKSVYSALSDTYQFVIRPWKQQPIVIDTELRQDLEQLKLETIITKEVIKEVTQVTQIQPVTEITKEYIKVDDLELKKVKDTIADWEDDIIELKLLTRKLQSGSTGHISSPVYIGSQGLEVGGTGIFTSLSSDTAGIGNLGVGGSATIGSDGSDVLTVHATTNMHSGVNINSSLTVGSGAAYTTIGDGSINNTGDVAIGGNLSVTGTQTVSSLSTLASTSITQLAIGTTTFNSVLSISSTSGEPALYVTNAGNVGIGTTTPVYKHEVIGTGRYSSDLLVDGAITVTGTSTLSGHLIPSTDDTYDLGSDTKRWRDLYLGVDSIHMGSSTDEAVISYSTTSSYLGFDPDGDAVNELVIQDDGNLGIGTTSPVSLFSLQGDAYITGGLGIGIATSTAGVIQTSGNVVVGGSLHVSGDSIVIGQSSTDSLVINSSIHSDLMPDANATRDMGSPAYYWDDVYVDSITANNLSAASSSVGGTISATFTLNSDNSSSDTEDSGLTFFRGVVVPNALITWDSTNERFDMNQPLFIQNDSSTTTIISLDVNGTAGQTADLLRVSSSSGDVLFNISSVGNVGIGTTSPKAMLAISSSTVTQDYLHIASSTGTALYVGSDGNIGIGTAGPIYTLDVVGNIRVSSNIIASGYVRGTHFYFPGGNAGMVLSEDDIYFRNHNYDVIMYLEGDSYPSGNSSVKVGIGTTSPSAMLHIQTTVPTSSANLLTISSSTGSTLLTVQPSGNVGIGTTSPQSALEVITGGVDRVQISDPGSTEGGITFRDDSNRVDVARVGNTLAISNASGYPSGTAMLVDATTGNVGIGTTSPKAQLDIYGTGNDLRLSYDSTNYVEMSVDSSGRLGIMNGNVGIGTTSPSAKLHIIGTPSSGMSDDDVLRLENYPDRGWLFTAGEVTHATYGGYPLIIDQQSTGYTGDFVIKGHRNTILEGGNVGIGTTSPKAQLDIYGTGNDLRLSYDSTNYVEMSVDSSGRLGIMQGNVGIGTTSPQSALEVITGGVDRVQISDPGSTEGGITFRDDSNRVDVARVGNTLAISNASGYPSGTAMLVDATTGNVGIGTTSPKAQLDIYGTGNDLRLSYDSTNYVEMSVDSSGRLGIMNGNVGIGTTSPSAKLHIIGTPSSGMSDDDVLRLENYPDRGWLFTAGEVTHATYGGYPLIIDQQSTGYTGDFVIKGHRNTILEGGNVGIGTTSPKAQLDIYGTGNDLRLSYDSTNYVEMSVDSSGRLGIMQGNVGIGTTSPQSALEVITGGVDRVQISDPGSTEGGITFRDDSNRVDVARVGNTLAISNASGYPSGTAMLVDATTGNVGIGTTSPNAMLAIASSTVTQDYLHIASSTGTAFYVGSDGNVGVGTASPGAPLGVEKDQSRTSMTGTAKGLVHLLGGSDGAAGDITAITMGEYSGDADRPVSIIGTQVTLGGSKLFFGTSNSYASGITNMAMLINQSGNVGIGTTSPTTTLHVVDTTAQLTLAYDSLYFSTFHMESDGDMLISLNTAAATTTFQQNVQVMGNLGTADILFANSFRLTERDLSSSTQAMYWFNQRNEILLTIDENMNVGIGTTTPTHILTIAQGQGEAIADGWAVYSSEEYKENIEPIDDEQYTNILDNIKEFNIVKYNLKGTDKQTIGIITEQSPEDIIASDGKSINLYEYITYIAAGLKELTEQVGDLSVREDEGRIVDIQTELANLGLIVTETGVLEVDKLKAKEIELGSETNPSGMTIYDENTGQPYCLKVIDGNISVEQGHCDSQPEPEPEPEPEQCTTTYYYDSDGDEYGHYASFIQECEPLEAYVLDNTDCNDSDPNIYPDSIEICDDDKDNDCDNHTDMYDTDCQEPEQSTTTDDIIEEEPEQSTTTDEVIVEEIPEENSTSSEETEEENEEETIEPEEEIQEQEPEETPTSTEDIIEPEDIIE